MNENEWEDLEYLLKPTNTAITDGGLFSDTSNKYVSVNDNYENGYEMKNIAGSRNKRTDIRGSAYRLRRE